MAEHSTSKRATFAASSFANLRAAMGEGAGEPLRVALADIDEDPNQPRRTFVEAELEGLAQTIRERGVLQPIGLMPPVGGRYTLVFGARRLRASRSAGLSDIPAVIVPVGQRDYATQVIENQQRANLSNSELAAAVNQLHAEGKQGKDIASICNLKGYQVAAFRAVEKLPDFLRMRLDTADVRALYDLYRAWQKRPDAIQAVVSKADAFLTITDARRIIETLTGDRTSSLVLDREHRLEAAEVATVPEPNAPMSMSTGAPGSIPVAGQDDAPERSHTSAALNEQQLPPPLARQVASVPAAELETDREPAPTAPASAVRAGASAPAPKPTFVMDWNGLQGALVTTERPSIDGQVYLDIGNDQRLPAPFNELRPVEAR